MRDEVTRITRTGVQVAVGALVAWAAARGIDLDSEALTIVFLPPATMLTTWLVGWAERRIHRLIGYLNGPLRVVHYTDPIR